MQNLANKLRGISEYLDSTLDIPEFPDYMEEYCLHLPKEDVYILRKYWFPVSELCKERKKTLSGLSLNEDELLEESVRVMCIDFPEKRILKVCRILKKAHRFIDPIAFERTNGYKPGSSQSDILIHGSTCHYTKEFLLNRISLRPQNSLGRVNDTICNANQTTEYDPLSASKVISTFDLGCLEQMKIIDLIPCKVHNNKVIFATLIDNGFKMSAYHTVIEDNYKQCAKICIYNITSIMFSTLKKGVKIAIVNPYFKLGDDGYHFIRQESPEEIVVVSEPETQEKSSENHKIEGNKFFNIQNFEKAIQCYSRAINVERSNPIYWSNRAQCYIKLGYFERALSDAETAVRLETNNPKYNYRMAMAWSGLGDHEKSCQILDNIGAENPEVESSRQKELVLLGNTKGEFDFEELARKANRCEELEIGEYIGPISIGISPTHGHAMFATKDIKRGELLSVSKAAGFISQSKDKELKNTPLMESTSYGKVGNMRTSLLIQNITENVIRSKLAAFRVFPLYNKRHHNEPIQIELYSSKGYSSIRNRDPPPYQMQQIKDIVCNSIFSYTPIFDPDYVRPSGVWPMLSFCNHSCTGNFWQKCYRDVIIIRACTNISKGEELTTSFFDTYAMLTVEERMTTLEYGWNWVCICEMCEFECEAKNKSLLQRAVHLCNRVTNADHVFPPKTQFKLLDQAFNLAGLLQLGPRRFNSAVWQTIITLTRPLTLAKYVKKYIEILHRARTFLCERDLKHQWHYWGNCLLLANLLELGDKEFRSEAQKKYDEVDSYIMDIA